jgi:uncharacterized protein YgiM (DUF1202 family)
VSSKIVFFLIVSLLISGCNSGSDKESVATPTQFLVTSTLPAASTLASSQTPIPSPSQAAVAPVEGITSTQLNIRAQPSTGSNILGMISANTKVEILGKDPGGNWYQINYPQGVDEKGWVTAKYVTTAKGLEIRVIGSDGQNPNNGNIAVVQQQINVRSGPGTSFNSLGTLNAQDVVNLIGKDAHGTWLQIEFTAGPDRKGWVNAAFVQARGVENLPILAEAGNVVGTGTPTAIPPTATATVIPAWADNDSLSKPAASIVFEPLGTHTLIYTGDVSTPQGDPEDWIQFTPYQDTVLASLECDKNPQIKVLENGQPITFMLACGDKMKKLPVKAGYVYLIGVQAPQSLEGLQYIRYTIKIEMGQE